MFGKILPPPVIAGGVNTDRVTLKDTLQNGKVLVIKNENKPASLPPYREYDLDTLLEAGVSLQQLNPSVLGLKLIDDDTALKALNAQDIHP
ncbi:hypothetical protein [Microvirus D_HF32_302]|nr:hypothetical protein [Microvirus D_HF3_26]WMC01549.1 hypothetical protein [Microvirus D_HF32_302]